MGPTALKSVGRAVSLPEAQGEELFPAFSSFYRSPALLGSWSLPLSSKPAKEHLSGFSVTVTSSSDHSQENVSTFRDPCDYIGPTWISQDDLPISRSLITAAKSLLPYNVTCSRFLGIKVGTSLGAVTLPPQVLSCRITLSFLAGSGNYCVPVAKGMAPLLSSFILGFFSHEVYSYGTFLLHVHSINILVRTKGLSLTQES